MKMKCAKCREEYDSETYPCSCPKCYPKPTGYGKRLNQLSAEEMAWWHKHSFRPTAGKSYLCRRGCKEHGTVTGRVYVFDGSNLKHYSGRNVTLLLNGYNTLRQAYAFEETESVAEPANAAGERPGDPNA